MAENVFTKYGGKVRYTPDKVQSNIDVPVEYEFEDQMRNIALERDLTAANLLENDILLDMLDDTIDDQMKDFALPLDEANDFCGGPVVTWECYKKAKELLKIAPWIAYGYDPVQLTFTDRFVKRKGNVVFSCKDFDPDKFHNVDFDAAIDAAVKGEDADTESPADIQKKAVANQKKWAMLVLFWDLLWGKAEVKSNIKDPNVKQEEEVETMNANADALEAEANKLINDNTDIQVVKPGVLDAEGKPVYEKQSDVLFRQAKEIRRGLATSKTLPNTIMLDRPREVKHLKWASKNGEALENNLRIDLPGVSQEADGIKKIEVNPAQFSDTDYPWNENSVAAWIEFTSLAKAKDVYKDKSVPGIKSGFILSILVGFLGLIPKMCFFFLKFRFMFLKSIKGVRKWPFGIGKGIYAFLKAIIDILTALPAVLNTIFIEICIWVSLMPNKYVPNVSDNEDIKLDDKVQTDMEVEETPAGFVSLDCLVAAQTIVNRVHEEAIN